MALCRASLFILFIGVLLLNLMAVFANVPVIAALSSLLPIVRNSYLNAIKLSFWVRATIKDCPYTT